MSQGLSQKGYLSDDELSKSPGVPSKDRRERGPVAVIECIQDIPCNPCESACKAEAIFVGEDITSLPRIDEDKCIGCFTCLPICPGQAIFMVDESLPDGRAAVTMPYEFLPLPKEGEIVTALDRSGAELGNSIVAKVRRTERMDQTTLITLEVPRDWSMRVRAFKLKG